MPGSWMDTTIGDLASVSRGASPRPIASTRWFDSDSKTRWVRIADVNRSDGRMLWMTTQALSPDGIARSRYLKPGTLIMSIAATVGIPVITGVPACIHDGFVSLESLKADKRFMLYLLKASEPRLREAGQSGSQMNVNSDIVRRLNIRIPADPAEQRRIASALWDTDDLIAALQRLIAKKRAIKHGMMQRLLTGRIRLPGFTGQWRSFALGDLVAVLGGGTPSRGIASYWGGAIPWATIKDVSTFDPSGTQECITPLGLSSSAARFVPAGTPILATRMLVGKAVRFNVNVAINQDLKALVPGPEVDGTYLCHWFGANGSTLAASAGGSTVAGTSSAQVKSMNISLPSVGEQRAIALVLDDADAELAALERRLASSKDIKRGMMQELLTGRTGLSAGMEVTS